MSQSTLFDRKSKERPCPFLDHVIKTLGLKNDAALARRLEVTAGAISRIRAGAPISDDILLDCHDEAPAHLPIHKLQELRGAAPSPFAIPPDQREPRPLQL